MTATTPFNYFHGDQSFEIHLDQIASLSEDHRLSLMEQTHSAAEKYAAAMQRDPSRRNTNLFNWANTWNKAALSSHVKAESLAIGALCSKVLQVLNNIDACNEKLSLVEKRLDLAFARIDSLGQDLDDLPLHHLSNAIL